ncbi:hypothetical protein [Legionella sp. CNM-4043-24]|uniref:hypothetical protein n=1 Tax=Legionella sp. CNM-4043-24 TaxID=3421646 RepID=UPI00403ACCD8
MEWADREWDLAGAGDEGNDGLIPVILLIASLGLLRGGHYRAALRLYPNSGGGGLNIYKVQDNGQWKRHFAVDYHPFWDREAKRSLWRLHYHRGETSREMRLHRPYEGGY